MATTFPLVLRTPSTEQPLEDLKPCVWAHRLAVTSSQLSHKQEGGKPSFSKRLTKIFSSSTPRYACRVYIKAPRIIQLDHPENLAFNLWMIPILHPEFTTIDRTQAPAVELTAAAVGLVATYRLRAPDGAGIEYQTFTSTMSFTGRRLFQEPISLAPLWNPAANDASAGARGPHSNSPRGGKNLVQIDAPDDAFDLGDLFRIRVRRDKANFRSDTSTAAPGGAGSIKTWDRKLVPTMESYNVAVDYVLQLKLEILCAGKKFELHHEMPVAVLETSEVQMTAMEQELGPEGWKKNYDDFGVAMDNTIDRLEEVANIVGNVIG